MVEWFAFWNIILWGARLGDTNLSSPDVRRVEVGDVRRELVRVGFEDDYCSVSYGRLEVEAGSVLQSDFVIDRGGQFSCFFVRQVPSSSSVDELVAVYCCEACA